MLQTGQPPSYRYLQMESTEDVHFGYQEFCLSDVIDALSECLTFSDTRIDALFSLVRGILHLGQMKYTDSSEEEEAVAVEYHARAAKLLGLDEAALVAALTTVTLRDNIKINCSARQAFMATDALANALYARLFDYLVSKINAALNANDVAKDGKCDRHAEINILDMFGFENLAYNGLEQLLINYANEVLHRIYLQEHIMHLQEEYRDEGIEGIVQTHRIDASTVDNGTIIECFEHLNCGIFSLLHEQSLLLSRDQQLQYSNGGVVDRFCTSFMSKLQSSALPSFSQVLKYNKLTRRFHIAHFASDVSYTADEMLVRNCFVNLSRFEGVMSQSINEVVSEMYFGPSTVASSGVDSDNKAPASAASMTICKTFKQQIQRLLQTIGGEGRENKLYYLKCIKSNDQKRPLYLDLQYVTQQVQYSGLVPAASIDKICFAYKQTYALFHETFNLLFVSAQKATYEDEINLVLEQIGLSMQQGDYALGKTYVYISKSAMLSLQSAIGAILDKHAITCQKWIRGYLRRRCYAEIMERIIRLQCTARCFLAKVLLNRLRLEHRSSSTIQAHYRMRKVKYWYKHVKRCVVIIQSTFRQYLALKHHQKFCSYSASLIQTTYRAYRAYKLHQELRYRNARKIQIVYHMYKTRRQVRDILRGRGALKIQTVYRSYRNLKQVQLLRNYKCVTTIQRAYRAHRAFVKATYLRSCAYVKKIQCAYRAFIAHRRQTLLSTATVQMSYIAEQFTHFQQGHLPTNDHQVTHDQDTAISGKPGDHVRLLSQPTMTATSQDPISSAWCVTASRIDAFAPATSHSTSISSGQEVGIIGSVRSGSEGTLQATNIPPASRMLQTSVRVAREAWRKTMNDILERVKSHQRDVVLDLVGFAHALYFFSLYLHLVPLD
ncbi:hypothetical protein EON65_25700 [archaeon]|nr:MAG: hypothetical protein EON65_25700 [archaeon]